MGYESRMRLAVTLCILCAAASAQQGLTTEPETITFTTMDQVALVRVLRNGQPVSITSVKSHQFNVDQHTYEYMVSVSAQDGKLRVKPTGQLEVGSYILTADTNAGRVVMTVYAPLSEMPDSLEACAKRAGVTIDDMKKMLGLASEYPRSTVTINLPPVYYEGQTLVLTMPPKEGRVFTWGVNGKVVREGVGENELVYTFPKPGEYLITYMERDGEAAVASGAGSTTVRELPAIPVETAPGTELVLRGLDGYRRYEWIINGNPAGNTREIRYLPPGPGTYDAEVRAMEPAVGPHDGFVHTKYRILVR